MSKIYRTAALEALERQQTIYQKAFESPALKALEKQNNFYAKIFESIQQQQLLFHESFTKKITTQIDFSPSFNAINSILKSCDYKSVTDNLSKTILEFSKSLDCTRSIHEEALQQSFISFAQAYASDLSKDSIDDFSYTIDLDDNVELSEPLENVVDGLIETLYEEPDKPSHELVHNKKYFIEVLLPIIIAVLSFVYAIHSDIQTSMQLEEYHQEELSIQRQLLQESQKQTEYLEQIAEKTTTPADHRKVSQK